MYRLTTNDLTWISSLATFEGSERTIPFATAYSVVNPKTGNSVEFKFTHSTGPEFDPNTSWVYKSTCGLNLVIKNDKDITEMNAAHYLAHKLGN